MAAEEKDDGYVRFYCDSCGKRLKIKNTYDGGHVVRCPSCGQQVNVPLANIQAVADATLMDETGKPGQLQLDPEKLMERLRGSDTERDGPGSPGSTPSLREGPWSAEKAFGRMEELDHLMEAVVRTEQEALGDLQRLYRKTDLNPSQRAQYVRDAGEHRRNRLKELVQNRIQAVKQEVRSMEPRHENLNKSELRHLKRLRKTLEAMRFYSRFVLRIEF